MDRLSRKVKRWFYAEYFYSYIDKPYFMQNELVDPLEALDMPYEYNQKEWQLLRSVMAQLSGLIRDQKQETYKRRIFSEEFIKEEQQQLNQYREIFRDVMKQYQRQCVTLNVTSSYFKTKRKRPNNEESGSTDESAGVLCDFDIEAALEHMPLQRFTI